MARLPDVTALGARPEPKAPRAIATLPDAGAGEKAATAAALDVGGSFSQIEEKLTRAHDRIQKREDTIATVNALTAYDEFASAELRKAQTEGDLSDLKQTKSFGEILSKRQNEIEESYSGSADAKAQLTANLERIRSRTAISAATIGAEISAKKTGNLLGAELNRMIVEIGVKPGLIASRRERWNQYVSTFKGALAPEQEQEFIKIGERKIVGAEIANLIGRSASDPTTLEEADLLLGDPAVTAALPASDQEKLRSNIAEAKKAIAGAGEARGRARRAEIAALLGPDATPENIQSAIMHELKLAAPDNNVQLATFRFTDGTFKSIMRDDRNAMQAALDAGGVETPRSIQAGTASALETAQTPTPKEVRELSQGINRTIGDLNELGVTADLFAKTPSAGGIVGLAIEKAGGLAQQVTDLIGLEIKVPRSKEVTEARTQARFTTSRLLTVITQEESGRFTEAERTLAQDALRTLDPTASSTQIKEALDTSIRIMRRSEVRLVQQLVTAAGIDLNTDDGLLQARSVLLAQGYTTDGAIRVLRDLLGRTGR